MLMRTWLIVSIACGVSHLVSSQCPNSSWTYYATSGSCYFVFNSSAISVNDANADCSTYNASLVSIDSSEEQLILDGLLQYNYNKVWMGLFYQPSSNSFVWLDGWINNYTSRWASANPNKLNGPAVFMYKDLTSQLLAYQTAPYWYSTSNSSTAVDSYICEFVGPRCSDVLNVTNATASTWKNYLSMTVTWTCLEGYRLPPSALRNDNTTSQYYEQSNTCIHNDTSGMMQWVSSTPVACIPKNCYMAPTRSNGTGLLDTTCDICSITSPPYGPGSSATYSCRPGAQMPYGNTTSQKAICGNNPNDPTSNIWKPSVTPCVFVRCPSLLTIAPSNYLPVTGISVYNQQIKQGASQLLTQFGSVVNFTCVPGFIFADNIVTRLYRCDASGTTGYWTIVTPGVSFSASGCNAILCPNLTNTISNYIASGSMNLTDGDFRQTQYAASFTLECAEDWAFPDSSTSKTLTCNNLQMWSDGSNGYSSVPNCLKNVQSFLGAIKGQAYEPPKQESPSAASDSSVIFILLAICLTLIIVMDIAVLPRDLGILRQNWHRLNERCCNKRSAQKPQSFNNDLMTNFETLEEPVAAPVTKITV